LALEGHFQAGLERLPHQLLAAELPGEIERDREGRGSAGARGAEVCERGGGDGALLSAEDRRQIESYQRDLLAVRADLRAVQRSLRESLDGLRQRLLFVNIAAVPILVAVLALVLALVRRQRRRRPVLT
ncbi:MAG: hypothetical protein VXY90_12240, partial [Pseudomonadota bacterium]|nr:hypothetical protein [Pseudomonadota bacterium]